MGTGLVRQKKSSGKENGGLEGEGGRTVLPIDRKLCRITQNGRVEWKSERPNKSNKSVTEWVLDFPRKSIKRTDF